MKPLPRRAYKEVPGQYYGTPKEMWGFRTRPARGRPAAIARDFVRAHAATLGLTGIQPLLKRKRVVESLGARHVILQQHHLNLRVHRAYITVHMDRRNRVYLAKNRTVPQALLPTSARFKINGTSAQRRAVRAIGASARDVHVFPLERMWFPRKARLRPAFRVRVHRSSPREEWIIYVDGRTGAILSKYDNLALVRGRARIFDPNPVIALGDWRPLVRRRPDGRLRPVRPPRHAYADVTLRGLEGTGYLDGRYVTTRLTYARVQRLDHQFDAPSTRAGFDEAMAYFHIDRAIRYLESLGYRGRRAIFRTPLDVDAHGTADDNSWYSPGMRRLAFGTGGVDDAEDAETILHEFGHALQDAICPDFGQSLEAAAMGEGFGDYFAVSFFAERKPPKFRTLVSSWDSVMDEDHDPPRLRRIDEPLTFESFDYEPGADEHENGKIWSATLWDIRESLGREVADRIIIESHFQLDGFTRFARGARAIIDADRNLYSGRHVRELRRIFQARGIGPTG